MDSARNERLRCGPLAALGLAGAVLLMLVGCEQLSGVREMISPDDTFDEPVELKALENEIAIKTLWRRDIGAGETKRFVRLRASVDGERVFATDREGEVSALSLATGEPIWQVDLDVLVGGGVGFGAGLVMIGSDQGEVIALRDADGSEAWRAQVSSEILAPPAVSGLMTVVRTADGNVLGLDTLSGERVWSFERTVPVLSLRGTGTPRIVGSEAVIYGTDSGRLFALSLSSGQMYWEFKVAEPRGRSELERMVDIDSDPVIDGDTVYAVSFQGRIAAVDLASGQGLWQRDMSSFAGLGLDASSVYVSDDKSHIWALERSSSATLWRNSDLEYRKTTAPVEHGDYMVVGDFEGYLHWLSKDDGRIVARMQIDNDGIATPPIAVGRNTLLVYGRGGTVSAIGFGE